MQEFLKFFLIDVTRNPDYPECIEGSGGARKQIRSSAWLEHYTDNVGVSSSNLLGSTKAKHSAYGGLAQLARALALQARGHRFESDILHKSIYDLRLQILD